MGITKSSRDLTPSKTKFDDSDEYKSASEEEKELELELANVSFEDLQKAKSTGFHVMHEKPKKEKLGRANKNRPMEISSKKPVGRFREVIQVPKKVIRDPRFESLCGNLDTEGFRDRYKFLYETELPVEKKKLENMMKKSKDPKVITDVKERISSIEKRLKSGSADRTAKKVLTDHKKKEREAVKEGKQPYYLKKSEVRERVLLEKYKSLKESGKLESFMENRRKKNASKDHRYMPYRRPGSSGQQEDD